MASIVLVRSWAAPRWLRAHYQENADAGVAWVERRKAPILAAFGSIQVKVCLTDGVTGVCQHRRVRRGARDRHERRITANIGSRYPYLTYHGVTDDPIYLASAAEAVAFILGHETAHIVTSSEQQAEDRGLRWLAEYRVDTAGGL